MLCDMWQTILYNEYRCQCIVTFSESAGFEFVPLIRKMGQYIWVCVLQSSNLRWSICIWVHFIYFLHLLTYIKVILLHRLEDHMCYPSLRAIRNFKLLTLPFKDLVLRYQFVDCLTLTILFAFWVSYDILLITHPAIYIIFSTF